MLHQAMTTPLVYLNVQGPEFFPAQDLLPAGRTFSLDLEAGFWDDAGSYQAPSFEEELEAGLCPVGARGDETSYVEGNCGDDSSTPSWWPFDWYPLDGWTP